MLFDLYGGPKQLANDLDFHVQHVCHWRTRGAVPMKWVGPVSRLIKCGNYALNYEGMINLTGAKTPWEDILDANILHDERYNYVVKGKFPKTPDEILGDKK